MKNGVKKVFGNGAGLNFKRRLQDFIITDSRIENYFSSSNSDFNLSIFKIIIIQKKYILRNNFKKDF